VCVSQVLTQPGNLSCMGVAPSCVSCMCTARQWRCTPGTPASSSTKGRVIMFCTIGRVRCRIQWLVLWFSHSRSIPASSSTKGRGVDDWHSGLRFGSVTPTNSSTKGREAVSCTKVWVDSIHFSLCLGSVTPASSSTKVEGGQ
jgi:hypothetical protein